MLGLEQSNQIAALLLFVYQDSPADDPNIAIKI